MERPPCLNPRHLYTPRYFTPHGGTHHGPHVQTLSLSSPRGHWNRLSRGHFSRSPTPDPSSPQLPLNPQLLNFLFPPVIEPSSALVYSAPNRWLPLTNPFPPLPASENSPASLSSVCFIAVFFPGVLKILFVPVSRGEHPPPSLAGRGPSPSCLLLAPGRASQASHQRPTLCICLPHRLQGCVSSLPPGDNPLAFLGKLRY